MIRCSRFISTLFTAGTCSSDADCLSQSCRNDSMSKCDTHNHCHCTQRPACGHGHDTDCRNLHCSSGFKGTCSNGHCHCQRGMPYYIILYASSTRRGIFHFYFLFCSGAGGETFTIPFH